LLKYHFKSSPLELLKSVFPDFRWRPWLFSQVPKKHYDRKENVKEQLDWLLEKAGLSAYSDLKMAHFEAFHSLGLLQRFNNSPELVVKAAGEDYHREKKPMNYWSSLENRKAFVCELGAKLGIKENEKERWYDVSSAVVLKEDGGGRLLRGIYHGSMRDLLSAVYPEYDWLPWKFQHIDRVTWQSPAVMKKAVAYLEKELQIKTTDDWYTIHRLLLCYCPWCLW